MKCPIISKEIEDEECEKVIIASYKEGKDKQAQVSNKFKRIIGWKAICMHCKNHVAPRWETKKEKK